jgi:AAA domain
MTESFPVKFSPTLAINRLLVFRKGQTVYDQKFHFGVNIIRGTNGSGKSTIMDFIFHILGGEVLGPTIQEWKEYSSLCDLVVADVTINDAVVTLRREVTPERSRPLHLFFGGLEIANRSVAEGWQTFSYSRQGSRESFSQILFRALQMPEASTPEGNNITMHQVLRLLYADQMTPVQRIFRFENFDPPILKQAVGDFLCGVGEFNLYEKQVVLRGLEKQFDDINSELKSIFALGGDLEVPLARGALTGEIDQLTSERIERYLELEKIAQSEFGADDSAKRRENERRQAFNGVGAILARIQSLESENRTLEFEIADSEQFIRH